VEEAFLPPAQGEEGRDGPRLVLNPNFLREVTDSLHGAGVTARVIDLMSGGKLAA
jgi:hypothetical protein